MKFSVIIPTLNEEQHVGTCLDALHALDSDVEIIVADGGSTDGTIQAAEEYQAIVCHSECGRGKQCNAGASLATGDTLVFLHVDTRLPSGAFVLLEKYFRNDDIQIGTFQLSFDVKHWLLDLYLKLLKLELDFTHFGDHGIVVRKTFFDSVGGFPNWPLFEDSGLIRKASRKTHIYRFPATVTTSARRFIQNGILRQQLCNTWYTLQYLFGVSPERLGRKYNRKGEKPSNSALMIFARLPSPGTVKTRLASSLGSELATRFYRLCAEHVFRESIRVPGNVNRYVFHASKEDMPQMGKWAGSKFYYAAQAEGQLGGRMEHAFRTAFSHGAQKAIVVATDVPDLSVSTINDALHALETCDIVVGPSPDGGYYLLGMKQLYCELFKNIPWSTGAVLPRTLNTIKKLKLDIHLLPPLVDIDTEEDLRRWTKEINQTRHNSFHKLVHSLSP